MQHWVEMNLVTLQKLIETTPRRMRAVIKGGTKYQSVRPVFLVTTFCVSVVFSKRNPPENVKLFAANKSCSKWEPQQGGVSRF